MYAALARRSVALSAVRAKTTARPASAPPTMPIKASSTVQRNPSSKNVNSPSSKGFMCDASPARVVEEAARNASEHDHEQPRHRQVQHDHRAVDLEAAE